jgi:predicted Zn-dependent protease with MMP-like domain
MNFDKLSGLARQVTEQTLASLPEEILSEVSRVPVMMERRPSEQDIADGMDPDLLGLFDPGPNDTPHIRLWLENLWDYAGEDLSEFEEEVRITLLHELGHFLGWDEDDLEDRGLG